MALIAMCCFDTEENERSDYTRRSIESLLTTVNLHTNSLVIIDNNSCKRTKDILKMKAFLNKTKHVTVITLSENVGTARAINMGIQLRKKNQSVIKIDNDVVINQSGWVEEMEEVIKRDPTFGIVGLKRKDLRQSPYDPDPNFRSRIVSLPHKSGERWINVEETNDIMGTCTMLSSDLLDKVGFFSQPSNYGYDDTLMSLRSRLSGFKNCFLPHIDIDHIDTGSNPYTQDKQQQAGQAWQEYAKMHREYESGERSLYVEV